MPGIEARADRRGEAIKMGLREALRGATPLETKIVSTHYLSYLFSMGNPPLQNGLLYQTRGTYDVLEFSREFPTANALDRAIRPRLSAYYLPGFHRAQTLNGKRFTKEKVVNQFENDWDFHRHVLNQNYGVDNHFFNIDYEMHDRRSEKDNLLMLTRDFIKTDIRFVEIGRSSLEGEDSHESFFRTFVLQGKSLTQDGVDSSAFDAVFAKLRTMLATLETIPYEGEYPNLKSEV